MFEALTLKCRSLKNWGPEFIFLEQRARQIETLTLIQIEQGAGQSRWGPQTLKAEGSSYLMMGATLCADICRWARLKPLTDQDWPTGR